ncbi:MAG: ATP-binding cassette domain-containing protein, partial [Bacteroidota bacterium]
QFVAAEIVIILVIGAVEKIMGALDTIYDVMTSLEKIGYVTDLPLKPICPDTEKPLRDSKKEGVKIEATGLTLSFEQLNQPLFEKADFKIQPGTKIAIKGASRSGKTALLRLMSGRIEADTGSILYNGLNRLTGDHRDLYGVRSVLDQDQLIHGTIRENISMGIAKYTDEMIMEMCKISHLTEDLKEMKNGLGTIVDSSGSYFPRSTRFKILLTRALLTHPELLLIEALPEALPQSSRTHILEQLTSKDRPWTLLLEGNSEEVASYMDGVLNLEDGNVVYQSKND